MDDRHRTTARIPWVVAVTGASGTPYAAAVVRGLLDADQPVDLVVSRAARLTMLDETGLTFREAQWEEDVKAFLGRDPGDMRVWKENDFTAGPASGSYRTRGMVIVPATTAVVAGVAAGMSKDLVQRAADVTLKERRRLVIVPREAPLRRVTLQQMADLSGEGAVILPASPGFYAGGRDVQQLIDFVAGKVLDMIDVPHTLYTRWTGTLGAARAEARDGAQPPDGTGSRDGAGARDSVREEALDA